MQAHGRAGLRQRLRDKRGGFIQGFAVPQKQWIIDLSDARILVSRATVRGNVESFAVVLLVWTEAGWECATRYDCAHGLCASRRARAAGGTA